MIRATRIAGRQCEITKRIAILVLVLALPLAFLACDAGEPSGPPSADRAASTPTPTPVPADAPSGGEAPVGSGPSETGTTPSDGALADEAVPGGIEAAARKLLADELEVGEEDLRLVSSEGMGWSDASLGCPQEGMAYAQVLTSGYKLIFDHAGTSYAVHTNIDGTNAVVCRDDSGVSASTEGTPTPEAETQNGAELTTQGYVEALQEAISSNEDAIEDAAVKLLEDPLLSGDVLERLGTLETAESWSEEDAAFASEFAETFLRAITDFHGYTLQVARDTLDELSDLTPPEHLSDFHEDFTRAYGEVVRFTPELLASFFQDVDTRIRTREDLADFYAFIDAADSGLLDPDIQAKGEDLAEQVEEACQELQDQLEAELERDVDICE